MEYQLVVGATARILHYVRQAMPKYPSNVSDTNPYGYNGSLMWGVYKSTNVIILSY